MDEREQGIEFGDLADDLEAHDYPVSADELREEYGDRTLGLSDGETTFGEALLATDREFDGPEDVKRSVFNGIESDAVGQEGYSDRGAGEFDTDTA